MPSLNQAVFIEESIASVLTQDYANIELIVADGGSVDDTVPLLKRLQQDDPRLKWFSSKDNGPAQALNRALAQVRGTVVGWLNSDDIYTPGAIRRAVEALAANPPWVMVYGHGRHIDAQGTELESYPTLPPSTSMERFADGCFICQPTMFFRRTVPVLLGKLDEGLTAAFDFDYWIRAFLAFPGRIGFIDALQASSRLHDGCITQRMRRAVALEGMAVVARHFGHAPNRWLRTYVEELISSKTATVEYPDLRSHVEATIAEAAVWMNDESLCQLTAIVEKDERLDQPLEKDAPFPAFKKASNCLIPEWQEVEFQQAISLGSFCHAAAVIRQCGFRKFSGPFDWIFSSPEVTIHALQDNFEKYLDPAQYEPVPEDKRVVADANLCDHRFYRDKFGLRHMFNHHLPTEPRDYSYLQRCVERFRSAIGDPAPKLFLLVTHQPVTETRFQALIAALDAFSNEYLLLVIRFFVGPESEFHNISDLNVVRFSHNFVAIDFPVKALSNGVEFPYRADNDRFLTLMKTFRVHEHAMKPALPRTAEQFDEKWYLATYPDVAEAIRSGKQRSGWLHYIRHGRLEGREAKAIQ